MTTSFNIPTQITQGDRISWSENLSDYDPSNDTLKCFIRGATKLDLIGTSTTDGWDFVIESAESEALTPGEYFVQFAIYKNGTDKKTIGDAPLLVCPSFENLNELDLRSDDEKELEQITTAIAKLASGAVAEYRIGDRMMRYQDLEQLTRRQDYLRKRIAIAKGRMKAGGRNVGVRFSL